MFHDDWGVTFVTLSLGFVEFVAELDYFDDKLQYLYGAIVIAAVVSFVCIGLPLLLWRFYY